MNGRTTIGLAALLAMSLAAAPGCGGAGDGGDDGRCRDNSECPGGLCIDNRCVPLPSDADGDADADGPGGDADADADTEVPGPDADADTGDDGGDGEAEIYDGSLTDTDGDTIPDDVEGWDDVDGDGLPNAEDTDSDGDGIDDATEAVDDDLRTMPPDSDRDGTPDFLDTDSDDDTITDEEEWLVDPDGDTVPAYRDWDTDNDGIFDDDEAGDDVPGTPPVDSDGDLVPDYQDLDSDNDWISDAHEALADTDEDTVPDRLDADSDNDTVLDSDEAGDTSLDTEPQNCDGDLLPNYRDTDSDNDGIRDGDEVVAFHTDPCVADTDGDTVTDLIETTYGSDPLVGTDSPRTRGDFVFVEPYLEDPEPWQDTLVFSTALQKADVYFLVDTTGSMGGEIANLRTSIHGTLIPGIRAAIPETWLGVGKFDDVPIAPFGGSGDYGYQNMQNITDSIPAAQAGADALWSGWGYDDIESDIVALYAVASGDHTRTLPAIPAPSCAAGRFGYPCFRSDAVAIIILFTDSPMHNGPGGNNYSGGASFAPSYAETIAALNAHSIHVIGVNSGNDYVDPAGTRRDLNAVARDTGAVDAGGGVLVYDIPGDGSGLGDQVINAVRTVATNIPIRVDAQFVDDPGDAVDTQFAFLDYIEANTSGVSIFDPATGTTRVCTAGLATGDSNGDGHPDYFPSLLPGTSVCWDIHVKRNETVEPAPDPQIFRATINVIGDLFTPLDSRDIYFLVPPVIEGSQ
jgi:hypothetical protein